MPSYEYQCKIHGEFEAFQSIADEPLKECPQCATEGRLEYECRDCHATINVPNPAGATIIVPAKCSTCPSEDLDEPRIVRPKKLISLSSFQLVGGGWAKDNYK